jgi:hypothetical protein
MMRSIAAGVALCVLAAPVGSAAGCVNASGIAGRYTVTVTGFAYDREPGCEFNNGMSGSGLNGCGAGGVFFSTCEFRVTADGRDLAQVAITCGLTIPSDWAPRPFNVSCDGPGGLCPDHELRKVRGEVCQWDLVDINGHIFSVPVYRLAFARPNAESFTAAAAAGSGSDVDHDGDQGIATALFGVRQR